MIRHLIAAILLLASIAGLSPADVGIQSGGASFPNPIYQQWIKEFGQLHPDIRISYSPNGSGAGLGGFERKTFDFAGSDAPMDDEEMKLARASGGDVVEIPSAAGAVVLAYNIPGLNGELRLSGTVLADIYLGRITRWNDPAIVALNPGANLPAIDITPVHRSDGSGTNFVFTSYLCTQSDEFETTVYIGKTVNWPNGQGASGNAGVTQAVENTQGAIGYIELDYAVKNGIPFASLQNNSGKFVKASPAAVSAAGDQAVRDMDEQKTLAVRLWDRDGEDVYPISSFTYLICYKDLSYLRNEAKARAIVDFSWYATHDGQKDAGALAYAALSPGVQKRVERALETIVFDGKPLHPADK